MRKVLLTALSTLALAAGAIPAIASTSVPSGSARGNAASWSLPIAVACVHKH